MNSTDYQVNLLRERIRELETRMLQLEDRVVFHPPAQPQQEPVATLFGSLPVYDTPSPAQPQQEPEGWNPSRNPMTAQRAAYFMRRFKHEEKLLGPNEQAAVDYVIAMLEQPAQRKPLTDADLGMYIGKELSEYINGAYADIGCAKDQLIHFARAIEAAHNIKDNT